MNDFFEITHYFVEASTDTTTEQIYYGLDYKKAKLEYDSLTATDFYKDLGGVGILGKKTDKYKFVGELDPEYETIEDYPIEDYFKDSDYYELVEDGEREDIEIKDVSEINKGSDDILNEIMFHYKDLYGKFKYNTIRVNNGIDEYGDIEVGCIQLRIADHSENVANIDRYGSCDYYLSVVIANKNATENKFGQSIYERRSNEVELYFNEDNSAQEIINEIDSLILDFTEKIKEKHSDKMQKGGLIIGNSHKENGVKSIVNCTNKFIELEGGEAIINKEAVKKYHKELSKINQSTGGNPIPDPNNFARQYDKMMKGGLVKPYKMYIGEGGAANLGLKEPSFKSKFDNKNRWEISDLDIELLIDFDKEFINSKNKKWTFRSLPLAKVIKHDKLFLAYPELKDVLFIITYNEDEDLFSAYRKDKKTNTNQILYNFHGEEIRGLFRGNNNGETKRRNNEVRKRVLLHEIQHFIQSAEGHSVGSSIDKELRRIIGNVDVHANREELLCSKRNLHLAQAEINYKNSAGELESKDTENRMNLTEEERMKINPIHKMRKGGLVEQKENKEMTKEEFFELPKANSVLDVDNNINEILSQYSHRDMAKLQVSEYLSELKELGKDWLKSKEITFSAEFDKYISKAHDKARIGKGKEKLERKKELKNIKSKETLDNIIKLAEESYDKMEKQMTKEEKLRQGKKDAYLKKSTSYNGKAMTNKEFLDTLISEGRTLEVKDVVDTAKKNKTIADWEWIKGRYPFGNENHPQTIEAKRLKKIIDTEDWKKPEYRMVHPEGYFVTLDKFAYEYILDKTNSSKEEIKLDTEEKKEFDYTKLLKTSDVTLKEVFQGENVKTIKFEWNGNFYKWAYSFSKSAGSLKVWKFPTEKDLMSNMFTTGVKEEIIYNTFNTEQTTDEGRYIEFSISKWNLKEFFRETELEKGISTEQEHKETLEKVASGEITPEQGVVETAETHIAEDPRYYDKLNEMEGKSKKDEYEGSSTGTGALYEFFTPDEVVKKMWQLIYENGFDGGNILEPALGSGRLLKYAPKNCNLTGFEINNENLEKAKSILTPNFNKVELLNQSFETSFLEPPRFNSKVKKRVTWLSQYPFDLVIANPPYGKFTGLYKTHFSFSGQFEHFFIEYSMKLAKSGAIGCFLIPSSFLRNGISYNSVKQRIFADNKLVDAYRLPNNIFKKTQIGTDILILKKK